MTIKDEHGSIMLETALVLPIYILFIFFVIQMTFVWTAKQMTYYAAYCGARAALVYNPADYDAEPKKDGSWKTDGYIQSGIVHHAACTVLSWISMSVGGYDLSGGYGLFYSNNSILNEMMNFRIGLLDVPLSSNVRNQVFVSISEFEKIEDESVKNSSDKSAQEEPANPDEQFPAVTVRVRFRCPLLIPLGGPVIAYFYGAQDDIPSDLSRYITDGSIGAGGFTAPNGSLVHANLTIHGNYTKSGSAEYYSMMLEESCTMAKPYKTDTYPLMPPEDKVLMGMMMD